MPIRQVEVNEGWGESPLPFVDTDTYGRNRPCGRELDGQILARGSRLRMLNISCRWSGYFQYSWDGSHARCDLPGRVASRWVRRLPQPTGQVMRLDMPNIRAEPRVMRRAAYTLRDWVVAVVAARADLDHHKSIEGLYSRIDDHPLLDWFCTPNDGNLWLVRPAANESENRALSRLQSAIMETHWDETMLNWQPAVK